jgi:hypothetical protein
MSAQIGASEPVDTLVCDGKTLRGSIDETASGAARFIAQVSLYFNSLGVAIAQSTYATDAGGEIAALRQLLDRVELEGLLVQADALHANRLHQQARGWPRPGHHLDAAWHARSGVGGGALAWQRHGDRGAQQSHPQWKVHR